MANVLILPPIDIAALIACQQQCYDAFPLPGPTDPKRATWPQTITPCLDSCRDSGVANTSPPPGGEPPPPPPAPPPPEPPPPGGPGPGEPGPITIGGQGDELGLCCAAIVAALLKLSLPVQGIGQPVGPECCSQVVSVLKAIDQTLAAIDRAIGALKEKPEQPIDLSGILKALTAIASATTAVAGAVTGLGPIVGEGLVKVAQSIEGIQGPDLSHLNKAADLEVSTDQKNQQQRDRMLLDVKATYDQVGVQI